MQDECGNVIYFSNTHFVIFHVIQLVLSAGIINIFQIAAVNGQSYYCDYCDLNVSMFITVVRQITGRCSNPMQWGLLYIFINNIYLISMVIEVKSRYIASRLPWLLISAFTTGQLASVVWVWSWLLVSALSMVDLNELSHHQDPIRRGINLTR